MTSNTSRKSIALALFLTLAGGAGAFAQEQNPPLPPVAGMDAGDLKALTDQVVNSLNTLQSGGANAGTKAALTDQLTALVNKAMSKGKSSDYVLKLIDDALKESGGASLADIARKTGGKLDMRGILRSIVAKAAAGAGGGQGGADSDYLNTIKAEAERTTLTSKTPVKPMASAGGRVITIQPGDTLGSIASKYYGSASMWRKIYQANRDVLSNPDIIPRGRKLRLP